ncbi:MAG: DUF2459 domain-containing protein [Planctomycetes bacterium]|nr:DUF2459 domain-containing protein [Planctomycetota bacterium]
MSATKTGRFALASAALAGASACVAVVEPPLARDGFVEVLVVDEACHKGLVLPGAAGELVEWGFGHHGWYALEHNRWYHVPGTVLWPGDGALSRRAWGADERARRAPRDVVAFRADPELVRRLGEELEREFDRARESLHHSEAWQTDFVRSGERYWIFHDCHDATASWLEDLGCRVEPALVRLGLRFRVPRTMRD